MDNFNEFLPFTFQFVSISVDDILEAANVTFDEAMWALSALQAGYMEWPEVYPGKILQCVRTI